MKKNISLGVTGFLVLAMLSSCCDFCSKKDSDTKTKKIETKKGKKVAHMTPDGLKYEILKEATETSKVAQTGNKVTVHYTGWIDEKGEPGTKIDSSVDRGQPFTFTLDKKQVIVGFNEGIKEMKVGETRRLNIPSKLAYGSAAIGNIIPANSNLIFDIELIEVA